ncbi:MAG: NHLP family bacteriocin export ABC transporter peptidase/permease/ATPase subunit [Blautia sp.]|nr:NHLP family bacteriocin export ABC transporter peptidase/permease/ATPase subunit [Blautia sp.]
MKKRKQLITKGVARVPLIMQLEALECGAACLGMILAYFGKWLPPEQLRRDCGVSRDGSNAGNIMKAALSYGMEAEAYTVEPEALKEKGVFPCIVHWDFNHFVVLDGFKGNRAYLNDPAGGTYSVPMEIFDACFTGIVLFMRPGDGFVPEGKRKSMRRFIKNKLAEGRGALLFVALTTVIASLAGILNAGFSRAFMDRLLTGLEPGWRRPFMLGLFLLTLITLIAAWIQAIYSLALDGKMAVAGNASYMWKVLRLPQEFFSQRYAADIQMRKEANAGIARDIVRMLAPLGLHTVMMGFYLAVMLRYSVPLTLIGLFSVLLQVLMSMIITSKRVNITRVMLRDRGKLAAATTSAIDMVETIKAGGAENGCFERWAGWQASVNRQNNRFLELDQHLGLVPKVIAVLTDAAVLLLGIRLAMEGRFTAGMILAFQGFLDSFMDPAFSLMEAGQKLQEMRTQMERIEDVMEYPEDIMVSSLGKRSEEDVSGAGAAREDEDRQEQEPAGAGGNDSACIRERTGRKLTGHVSLRNVTFGYSPLDPPLIENLNLEIRPGQQIALVGASGCGKSTIAKLIAGLYQPWSGEILFDDVPLPEVNRETFIGSVSAVDQDIILFHDTVEANIRMWDRSIEDFEVILAARDARIHDEILRREGGYRHRIAEGGRDFSGGERQRLEIARALARDPSILILDEATSALDARTEQEIVSAIKMRGITCIVAAHRLSTIRDSDEILVLDQGRIVQRGTHEQLIKQDGLYKTLVSSD